MKKSLLALATLAAFAGAASAQSSVTLFGVVDVGGQYVKNGDVSRKYMSTDGLNSSRFGVRGIEDLGAGFKAGFWLESAVNPDNGTSNATRFWHRRSTVSLISGAGEIRGGRDLVPSFTGYADYDPFGTNGLAALNNMHSTLASGALTATRSDNMISYFLPANIGGLYGQLSVSPSENVAGNKYTGGRIGFAFGPVDLSVSGGQTKTSLATEDKYQEGSVGASFNAGFAKLALIYTQDKYLNQKLNLATVGLTVPVSTVGSLRMGYTKANMSGFSGAGAVSTAATNVDANDGSLAAIGYVHNLSKRTALYTTAAFVKNKGNATFSVAGSAPVIALTAGSQTKSTGYELGHQTLVLIDLNSAGRLFLLAASQFQFRKKPPSGGFFVPICTSLRS